MPWNRSGLATTGGEAEVAAIRQAEALARSEAALRHQTRVLQSILDSMGDGVIVAGQTGAFLAFNPAAEQILGTGRMDSVPDRWPQDYGLYLPDKETLIRRRTRLVACDPR